MKKQQEQGKLGGALHIVGNVVGIILIAVLLPVMIINLTLIIKSYTKPNQVPTFVGVAPLIVQSGSMEPAIKLDDLIFTKETDISELKEDDIIAFQPVGAATVVTHRIIAVTEEDGARQFTTKGDANNTADADPVIGPQIVGRYVGRIAGVGKAALFLQQPLGMVIFVAIPLALFLLYDLLRRHTYNKKKKGEGDAEKEELERLRALAASLQQQEEAAEEAAPAAEEPAAPAEEPAREAEAESASEYPPVEGEDDFADEV